MSGGLDSASFAAAKDAQNIPCFHAPVKLLSRNRVVKLSSDHGGFAEPLPAALAVPLPVTADVGSYSSGVPAHARGTAGLRGREAQSAQRKDADTAPAALSKWLCSNPVRLAAPVAAAALSSATGSRASRSIDTGGPAPWGRAEIGQ